MKKITAFVFLGIILATSCCKKCDQRQVIYSIGTEMYRYVFRDTSEWVYRNTSTSIYDTVIMYKMERSFWKLDTADECVDLEKEFFVLDFESKLQPGHATTYFIDFNGIRQDGTGIFPNAGIQIYNRLTSVGDSTAFTKYEEFYPSLIIEGRIISNIRKILLLYPSTQYPYKTYLYWSPNIGIVRKEIHDTINGIQFWDMTYSNLKYY